MMIRTGLVQLLLLWLVTPQAQFNAPTYFSQYTHGAGWAMVYTDIVVGDINKDNVPDVIFTMAEGYQVGIGHFTNGSIAFEMQPIDYYKHGWWYYNGQLVDYDQDGDLDFFTASTNNFDFSRTYIMENEGGVLSDTFRTASPEFVDKATMLFGKFNDDDIDDLFYFVTQPLSVHLQDGATGELHTLPFSEYEIKTGDFNNDGLIDFHQLLVNSPTYNTQTDNLYLNNGDYTFDRYETSGFLSHPPGIEYSPWGDFDGDGIDDQFSHPNFMPGLSFLFKSNIKSQNQARLDTIFITSGQFAESHIIMDVTHDGTEDMIVFTQDSLYFLETDEDMHFNVYRQSGIWHPALICQHPDLPEGTILSMTSAGLPLLLHLSYSDSAGLVIEQDYNAFSPYVINRSTYASSLAGTDLDADGQRELCIGTNFAVAFAEIQSDHTLSEQFIQGGFDNLAVQSISSGDWNGDGHDDLFLNESDQIFVATREPDSTLSEREYLTTGDLLDAYDFDRNGFSDLLINIYDSVFILFNDESGIINHTVLSTTLFYPEYAVFDPNGDGFLDVALSMDSTIVLINNGDGSFTQSPFQIPGRLAHNTLPNSKYLSTVLWRSDAAGFYYMPNLFRVATDGQDYQWIGGNFWLDTTINARETWVVNLDGDTIPDIVFNVGSFGNVAWKAQLINEVGVYDIVTVPDAFILGAEQLVQDGGTEILYVRRSQAFLLHGLPIQTSTQLPQLDLLELTVFPNPLPSGSTCRVMYESDYVGPIVIEICFPDGRVWHQYVRNKTTDVFMTEIETKGIVSGQMLIRVVENQKTGLRQVMTFTK
ncbi:MAG: VCBS repeat-containing protein [Saprospiraceae bacterium]